MSKSQYSDVFPEHVELCYFEVDPDRRPNHLVYPPSGECFSVSEECFRVLLPAIIERNSRCEEARAAFAEVVSVETDAEDEAEESGDSEENARLDS